MFSIRYFAVLRICGLVAIAAITGCATHADRLRQSRELFYSGNCAAAIDALQEQLERDESDRDVVALDLAMAELVQGYPETAESRLLEVRDRFDYLEQQDLAESAMSFLTDDTHRAYAGEDYERVMIRVMLAMTSLMTDGSDALAYCMQADAKQQQIMDAGLGFSDDNPKAAYKRVAMSAFLNGVLREATHRDYDDAERAFATLVSWNPEFHAGRQALERARTGHHSAPGNGVVYILALVGRGPYKRQVSEIPSSQALLIADRILSATGKHTLPPTIAPIKVPQVVTEPSGIDCVLVSLDGQVAGTTEIVTDIGELAVQQHQAIFDHLVARAVARRVIKKAAIYAAKDRLAVTGNGWANLAMDVAGVAWEATESADTRCWALLPGSIQVLRVELPAGKRKIVLQPVAAGSPLGERSSIEVPIEDGRNTYLLACYPGAKLAGHLQVSCP